MRLEDSDAPPTGMSAIRQTGKSALRFAGTEMLASSPRCARECGLILNALTQGSPAHENYGLGNPGLYSQTPLGFSEGANTAKPTIETFGDCQPSLRDRQRRPPSPRPSPPRRGRAVRAVWTVWMVRLQAPRRKGDDCLPSLRDLTPFGPNMPDIEFLPPQRGDVAILVRLNMALRAFYG